jgi:hypothetical protein
MELKKICAVMLAALFVSACATAPLSSANRANQAEPQLEMARAAVYLKELRDKKNRFLESQGMAADYQPGEIPNTAPGDQLLASSGYRAVSECRKIVDGDWGASVLYGQSFLGYENYMTTVARCYRE